MKIIDERETHKKKQNKQNTVKATVKGWELNDFAEHLGSVH